MSLQALLVSRDCHAVTILRAVLRDLEVQAEVCPELGPAAERLAERGASLVIADYDVEHASGLLKLVRQNYAGSCIALALVKTLSNLHTAYDVGANFVLIKPVTPEAASHSLSEALALVRSMEARPPRFIVPSLAYVNFEGTSDPAIILDISEGGMAVQALQPVEASGPLRVHFDLPGWVGGSIGVNCQLVWADSTGRAGLRFSDLSEEARHHLQEWLRVNRAMAESPLLEEIESPKPIPLPEPSTVIRHYAAPASPRVAHRIFSAVVDGVILLLASALWLAIFWLWARHLPASRWGLPTALVVPFFLWVLYLYVFLAHPHGTPGMQMAEKGSRAEDPVDMFSFSCPPRMIPGSARLLAWLEKQRSMQPSPRGDANSILSMSVRHPADDNTTEDVSLRI